jgi:hypothetical protein
LAVNDLCVLFPSLITAQVLEVVQSPKILSSSEVSDRELAYPRTQDANDGGHNRLRDLKMFMIRYDEATKQPPTGGKIRQLGKRISPLTLASLCPDG